ncbi:MAG: HAD family hydrolase [Eubacteriales bacterium]|nr:HAD family hydrolase [Eubacteriales bacterium]
MNNEITGLAFFDLDGTLLNNNTNEICESALRALEALRENGFKIILSTGRDMDTHYSREYLDIVKPDAVIHLNGSKITVGDELLFKHTVSSELLHEVFDFCTANDICMGTSIAGEDFFINPEKKAASDAIYNKFLKRNFVPFEDLFERGLEVSALSFAGDLAKDKPLVEEHFPNLKLFAFNDSQGADVVEEGFSKAEGMKKLCAYFGVPEADTYAFGDSKNDIPLLMAAGTGIAMGNADPAAKDAADYITDDIARDGILKACRHFGLIRY